MVDEMSFAEEERQKLAEKQSKEESQRQPDEPTSTLSDFFNGTASLIFYWLHCAFLLEL